MDVSQKVLEILRQVRAIITDSHFVLTSGRHAPAYVNKDALYPHTQQASQICEFFAQKVQEKKIEVVVGPALGGIILSQWTAYHLSHIKGEEILGVYTEKTLDNGQIFTREYDKLVKGKKVFVVEDLTSTGESAKKVVDAVRAAGGEVAAVSVMANRNHQGVTSEYFGAPFLPLAEFEVPSYEAENCPLCRDGIPINTEVGHGKKFLQAKGLL